MPESSKFLNHSYECEENGTNFILNTAINPESAKSLTRLQLYGLHLQQVRSNSPDMFLRKGHWTIEEDEYIDKMISLFTRGLLRQTECQLGTSLRAYLARKLYCNPLRITKKFNKMGKKVYGGYASYEAMSGQEKCSDCRSDYESNLITAEAELAAAEERFLEKIEMDIQVQMQSRKTNKKRQITPSQQKYSKDQALSLEFTWSTNYSNAVGGSLNRCAVGSTLYSNPCHTANATTDSDNSDNSNNKYHSDSNSNESSIYDSSIRCPSNFTDVIKRHRPDNSTNISTAAINNSSHLYTSFIPAAACIENSLGSLASTEEVQGGAEVPEASELLDFSLA